MHAVKNVRNAQRADIMSSARTNRQWEKISMVQTHCVVESLHSAFLNEGDKLACLVGVEKVGMHRTNDARPGFGPLGPVQKKY